jgi:CheY-like chemotaxis protein/signal transduction histidine kinase
MQRIYLILSVIILLLLALNTGYYIMIFREEAGHQKEAMMRHTEISGREIERYISKFMDEMNFILDTENTADFFNDPEIKERNISRTEEFFSRYNHLLNSIALHDDRNNVYHVFKESERNRITNIYLSREQRHFYERERVDRQGGETVVTLPVIKDERVKGNMVISINTEKFIESVFPGYPLYPSMWQWFTDETNEIIFSNFPPEFNPDPGKIPGGTSQGHPGGLIAHKLETGSRPVNVISAWYPVRIADKDFRVVFSRESGLANSGAIIGSATLSAATFVTLLLIILTGLHMLGKEQRNKKKSIRSEIEIKRILELLPAGIIIKAGDGKIKMINETALNILKIDDAGKVYDKDISNMFFLFRDYSGRYEKGRTEDTSELVYYDTDEEEEIILFKKQIHSEFSGEKVIVEAFIDLSAIEKVRKNEFLWGEVKTEFLKRVSHDIREPLNVILNLTDLPDGETGGEEKERIKIIRDCCEDILVVVDDIIDFSGFEAGKIMVEEIPFELGEEIELALFPLANKAQEKNIAVSIHIDENIPKNLIGDPFHIRQVIAKLASNSLKYTERGEIKLIIKPVKQMTGNLLLEFIIEDTGKGIPPALIKKLNENGNDAELLSSGCPGVAKTRQLIHLMKGEMHFESPLPGNKKGAAGTRVSFNIPVYSNDISGKKLLFNHIDNLDKLKAIILAEKFTSKPSILDILKKLNIYSEKTTFNNSTAEMLRSRLEDPEQACSIIFIIDSPESNGFAIARNLHENKLDEHHLVVIISSVNKPGNFIRSRRFGADHYIIEPCDKAEITDILRTRFGNINIPLFEESPGKIRHDLEILVAEDNVSNQIVAQSLFKRLGYDIDIASNGREALRKTKEKDYDVIFMDIRMPEKNGLDTTFELRMQGYKMPIVAMTANAGETDKTEAMEAGMNNFISKPVNINILKNIMVKLFPNS